MASESWRQGGSVKAELLKRPGRFDFFQAVRLLERLARPRHGEGDQGACHPVGYDRPAAREFVRFAAVPSLRFPATSIQSIEWRDRTERPAAEMKVTFMGLTGPSGVLPDHYTELLLQRRRLRDHTLGTFLDLFNHRLISLFYRAWEKYRLPLVWERSQRTPDAEDQFTKTLLALSGLGMESLRRRTEVADDAYACYAGYFARTLRSSGTLEGLLGCYLGLPVAVQQFVGQWLPLDVDDRTQLPSAEKPDGQHCGLGKAAMLGEASYDVQSRFRVKVGPLSYRQFQDLSPDGPALKRLAQFTRLAVGPEYDFEIQLLICSDDVPPCTLTSDEAQAPRLGWNTWIGVFRQRTDLGDAVHDETAV